MRDTEPSELEPERDTQPPRTLAEEVRDLTLAVVESNDLSIRSRVASERCSNQLVDVLARLHEGVRRFEANELETAKLKRRVSFLEGHLGVRAPE